MICPLCGHENLEVTSSVRWGSYPCNGDGCDYRFDPAGAPRQSVAEGFAAMWRRFYAALSPAE
jgi:hypothetical protein